MAQVNLMTQAQYADHRKVSRAAVSHAVTKGRISLIDGKIDPVVADIQWAQNTRARAPSSPASEAGAPGARSDAAGSAGKVSTGSSSSDDGDADGYWQSRGRREAAEAELAELKLAEQRGNLIQVKAVESVLSNALAGMREHLLQVSSRLAPLLANESDGFKVQALLDTEINQALQQLAGVTLPGASSPAVAA